MLHHLLALLIQALFLDVEVFEVDIFLDLDQPLDGDNILDLQLFEEYQTPFLSR